MRQIKFRAWDGRILHYSDNDFGSLEAFFALTDDKGYGAKTIYQQFTGLLDKNGKEIYEGDIVTHQHHLSEEDKYTVIRWTREEEDFHPGFVIRDKFTQGGLCEVVGNIFENPDLLK